MGKEQELLEAARNGNLTVVERILSQRAKKTGPLASLRRGPGANTQDQSGYTSLHHSALNGHKDIVSLLLAHEASTNVVDHKGSTPLHLAAWTGNTEIVRLLLVQGPSTPNVNLANHDRETALHSAAQYGHTDVVALLLEHNSDTAVRNLKEESALDLAAQYGRLEAVELLVKAHPKLRDNMVRKHSPLHLAARNGHRQVVKVLLDAGFNVNYITDTGSALHEAALYGKVEVVKLLLDYGININLEDNQKRTVLDLLEDLNTAIAKQTRRIVRDHSTLVMTDDELSPTSISPPPGFMSDTGSYANVLVPERLGKHGRSPPRSASSPASEFNFYEVPPPPRLTISSNKRISGSVVTSDLYQTQLSKSRASSLDVSSGSSNSRSPSIYEAAPPFRDQTELFRPEHPWRSGSRSSDTDAILYQVPPPPQIALGHGKRFSDPLQCTKPDQKETKASPQSWAGPGGYLHMGLLPSASNKPMPPAKPPRRSIAPVSPVNRGHPRQPGYEYLCLATSGGSNGTATESYVDMRLRGSDTYENHVVTTTGSRTTEASPFSALYDEIASGRVTGFGNSAHHVKGPTPVLSHGRSASDTTATRAARDLLTKDYPLKPHSLDLKNKRATIQIPLSPTNYSQPPTPDFPPPSPTTAECGIQDKIRPLSQDLSESPSSSDDELANVEYRSNKRVSRDIETLTEEELLATIESNGEVRLSVRRENKGVSTDNIEEIREDNPFAGLCRGSVCARNHKMALTSHSGHGEKKARRPRNVYENVELDNRKADSKTDKRGSSLSVMSPFDENAEWAEIADIMASFGSGIARESVFAREMEEHFANVLRAEAEQDALARSKFASISDWLSGLGRSEYENLLAINGFDDIEFMGGGMLEDQDLQDVGVSSGEHRRMIVQSARYLPGVKPLGSRDDIDYSLLSVDEWLASLHLEEYQDTFRRNNYLDLDRVLKLWEVELNTVLEITKLGHQKRILASLGDRSFDRGIGDLDDLDLSKLNLTLSELGIDDSSDDKSADSFIFKDYTALTPRSTSSAAESIESGSGSEGLKIRPPTQLMSEPGTTIVTSPQQLIGSMPSFLTAQWRHQPETLIQSCCNYSAQYLGSTLVKELKGMESSRKSIQKLKSSTRDIGKIPHVILSISYKGVKFIDAESKKLVCEHEIRNIHCACQDAEDLNHFAYITKEHQTNNHYCHVFCAQNMDLATEIILTLGQAFEVAYQMALRDKASNDENPKLTGSKQFVSQLNVQLVHENGNELLGQPT